MASPLIERDGLTLVGVSVANLEDDRALQLPLPLDPRSGVALDTPIAYVFEFDEGLIRKVRLYMDPSEALKAVGLEE